jgi:hypothetical protein
MDRKDMDIFKLMDDMSDEAAENGLTIETLGGLMEWDNETMENLFGEVSIFPINA